jgi:hypothetical protein
MYVNFIILLFSLIVVYFAIKNGWIIQSSDTFKIKILKHLNDKGYQLKEIIIPHESKTCPFPKIEIYGSHTEIMGFNGEKTFYRIVKYKNKSGEIKESWIRININAFIFVKIDWIPKP